MKVSKRVVTVSAVLLVLTLSGAGVYYRINHQEAAGQNATTPEGDLPEVSAGEAFSTDLAVAVEGAETEVSPSASRGSATPS